MPTPPKTSMDTQSDAIFEAGDTFQKPSFLISMLDFRGGNWLVLVVPTLRPEMRRNRTI